MLREPEVGENNSGWIFVRLGVGRKQALVFETSRRSVLSCTDKIGRGGFEEGLLAHVRMFLPL